MESLFDVDQWLKTLNVHDSKYDFVMHDSHWLTSQWDPDCPECLAKAAKLDLNNITSSPTEIKICNPKATVNNDTNSRITISNNNVKTSVYNSHITPVAVSSPAPPIPRPPTEHIIPVTPIAPIQQASRAFVTPHTSMKQFNDTFTRSTRQSTKKLLDQTAPQNLINLNETFDLYKSALEETPPMDSQPSAEDQKRYQVNTTQPISNGTKNLTNPSKQPTNFELLSNYPDDRTHHFDRAPLQEATSRIPRIPVRSSRNHDY